MPLPPVMQCRAAVRRGLCDLEDGAPGALVLAACSGGPDSTALAAALMWVGPRVGLRTGVLTVDHGLQEGSTERAAAVAGWARGAGADRVEVLTVTVGSAGGPEGAARTARYAALGAAADRLGAAAVLLGHTLDDQAETVLLGLGRGSGARSLAGMAEAAGRYRRPLLGLPRATTVGACAAQELAVWADPHNVDPAYARVRVRTQALPALERAVGPGVAAALARTARLLRDDADALDDWATRAAAAATDADGSLAVAALAELPRAVRRRVLLSTVRAAGSPAGAVSAAHVAGVDVLVTDWRPGRDRQVSLPGHFVARRRHGRLYVERLPGPLHR
jgi:tRNA(Ile)-lysidine synthase